MSSELVVWFRISALQIVEKWNKMKRTVIVSFWLREGWRKCRNMHFICCLLKRSSSAKRAKPTAIATAGAAVIVIVAINLFKWTIASLFLSNTDRLKQFATSDHPIEKRPCFCFTCCCCCWSSPLFVILLCFVCWCWLLFFSLQNKMNWKLYDNFSLVRLFSTIQK